MHHGQRRLSFQPLEKRKLMAADAGDQIQDMACTCGNDLRFFSTADDVSDTIMGAEPGSARHGGDGKSNVAMTEENVDGTLAADAVFRELGCPNEPTTSGGYDIDIISGVFVSGAELPPTSGSP